jgi:hypothetical protein
MCANAAKRRRVAGFWPRISDGIALRLLPKHELSLRSDVACDTVAKTGSVPESLHYFIRQGHGHFNDLSSFS